MVFEFFVGDVVVVRRNNQKLVEEEEGKNFPSSKRKRFEKVLKSM